MNISKIGPSFACSGNDCKPGEGKAIDFKPNTEFTVTVSGDTATEGDTHMPYPVTPFATVKGRDANGKEYSKRFDITSDKSENTQAFNNAVSSFYAIEAYKEPAGDKVPDDIKYWNY